MKIKGAFFIVYYLLFTSIFCAAQQKLPSKIIGGIPNTDGQALYQIQVGAFLFARNVVRTSNVLKRNGFNPVSENFRNLTRVIIPQIPANQIIANVIVPQSTTTGQDQSELSISEKWNITDSQSRFSSLKRSPGGTVGDGAKSEDTIGRGYLYSINGTYLVTRTDDSVAYISHWRWADDSREEFLFSHDNWQTFEREKITTLNENSLITSGITNDDYCEYAPALKK